ncbi:MAG: hypothetical protein ABID87_05875 [Chloroflexota bacterium]
MKNHWWLQISLLFSIVALLALPLAVLGCTPKTPPTPPPAPSVDLARTMVPDLDISLYSYVRQEKPTTISAAMIHAPADLNVASLALWGIPSGEELTLGGAVIFTSSREASRVYAQVKDSQEVWTSLSDATVYFVMKEGAAARELVDAISNKRFKYYDDAAAIAEIALLPNEGRTHRAGVAVSRPGPELLKIVSESTDRETAEMAQTLLAIAQIEVVAGGLYAPEQIDIARVYRLMAAGKVADMVTGALVVVKSGLPGIVVGPAVTGFLEKAKYTRIDLEGITVYRGFIPVSGVRVPALIRVVGNRIYLAVSPQEDYAAMLITGIKE